MFLSFVRIIYQRKKVLHNKITFSIKCLMRTRGVYNIWRNKVSITRKLILTDCAKFLKWILKTILPIFYGIIYDFRVGFFSKHFYPLNSNVLQALRAKKSTRELLKWNILNARKYMIYKVRILWYRETYGEI